MQSPVYPVSLCVIVFLFVMRSYWCHVITESNQLFLLL